MNKHPQAKYTRAFKERNAAYTVAKRLNNDQPQFADEKKPMDLSLTNHIPNEKPLTHHQQIVINPEIAHMLIFLENGEQRLIAFKLPTESCSVKELLAQVNVPFSADSYIQCILNVSSQIDYVISVSKSVLDHSVLAKSAKRIIRQPGVQHHLQAIQEQLKIAAVRR